MHLTYHKRSGGKLTACLHFPFHFLKEHLMVSIKAFLLSVPAFLLWAQDSPAQCMSGQQKNGQQQTGLQLQNGRRQQNSGQQPGGLQFQQLLRQMQQQGSGLVGLQQLQQQNGLVGWQQLQQQYLVGLQQLQQQNLVGLQQLTNGLLTAIQQQRQQNNYLLALSRKQQSIYQTGQQSGFATTYDQQQFQMAVLTAMQQTQSLLDMLQQSGASTQNPLVNGLRRQLSSLAVLSE
jgi:hypothetical protein